MKYSKGYEPNEVKTWLDDLIRTKGLFYREFARELRLWEGSDFDVYGTIRTQKLRWQSTHSTNYYKSTCHLARLYLPARI